MNRQHPETIAMLSHEIRTPISVIAGSVSVLKETPLTAGQRELVEKIERSSDTLLALANNVLDLSGMGDGGLSMHPAAFSLAEAVSEVEDLFRPRAEEKGLKWQCERDFPPGLCLYLDRVRLMQVLGNLVGNACKFTEEGYIYLSVELASETEDTAELEFCVEDSGIGIAEEDIPRLFREFTQLDNRLTRQHTGTGLGLAICRRIAESMGGRVWVVSEEGAGSSFYFTVPAPKARREGEKDELPQGMEESEQ